VRRGSGQDRDTDGAAGPRGAQPLATGTALSDSLEADMDTPPDVSAERDLRGS